MIFTKKFRGKNYPAYDKKVISTGGIRATMYLIKTRCGFLWVN